MLGGSALFAVMATFVGLAHARDPGLSTFVTSAVRSSVNLVLLVAIARGPRALWGDGRPALWSRGIAGGLALLTYFACIHRLSAGEAAFLNQTSAVWVVAASPWVLKERPSPLAWLAVLGSLVGIGLLSYPRGAGTGDLLGRGLGLFSGLSAAAAYLSIRKAATTNSPVVVVFYFTLVSTVASVLLAVATQASPPMDAATAGWLVGAGVAATVAQLLMTEAYRVGNTAVVAAAGAAGPLLTALGGWYALRQVPDGDSAAGMLVLLLTSVLLPFWAARG